MGTLGQYLREAREARGIDLREASQQTRINLNYLQALEQENFSKLPGEVFVKGFLKNYGKFLRLSELEIMRRYAELQPSKAAPVAAAPQAIQAPEAAAASAPQKPAGFPLEPIIWGAGILIILVIFLFTALPSRRPHEAQREVALPQAGPLASVPTATVRDKLYLEVIALENTWLLVRTDNSPQKKALLKKGESLIWSADERFLLSFGSAGALKLQLNGQELTVSEPKNTVVRDLEITSTGIVNKKAQPESVKKPRAKKPEQAVAQSKPSVTSAQSTTHASPVRRSQPQPSPQQQPPWLDSNPAGH